MGERQYRCNNCGGEGHNVRTCGEPGEGEHQDLVDQLTDFEEPMDDDEWEELYEQLDPNEKAEVDEAVQDFADNAVGHPSWRTDEDGTTGVEGL
jgi:hypothetical protein